MSAALVESVRDTLEWARDYFDGRADTEDGDYGVPRPNREMMRRAECDVALESVPAILAALTEAEALRAQVAAAEAREQEAIATLRLAAIWCRGMLAAENETMQRIENVIAAPTDTAALRAMLEAAVLAGGRWVARRRDGSEPLSAAGYAQEAADNRVEELGDPDDPDTKRIVDRVLGGS